MRGLLGDLKSFLRTLLREPGLSISIIVVFGLAIGANIAIFSVVDAVLMRPFSAPNADRLVRFEQVSRGRLSPSASLPEFNLWHQEADAFDYVAAHRFETANLVDGLSPQQIRVGRVTADFFPLFGARVIKGRTFSADEDHPGGPNVLVISYALWKSHFSGAADVIGKTATVGDKVYVVIGVLAPNFDSEQSNDPVDAWLPFQIPSDTKDVGSYCTVTGVLKRRVSIAIANSELQPLAEQFSHSQFSLGEPRKFVVVPLRDAMAQNVRSSLLLFFGALVLVLLTACANVSNLLAIHALDKVYDVAVQTALGASPFRIVRRMVVEGLCFSVLGGAVGLYTGLIGIKVLLGLYPGNPMNLPRIGTAGVSLDWRVFGFAFAVSLCVGILAGITPAIRLAWSGVYVLLLNSGTRLTESHLQARTRSVLVVIETALACAMLIGAGLLVRSYLAIRSVKPGFQAQGILTVQMSLANTRFEKSSELSVLVTEGVRRVDSLPGVEGTAVSCCIPLGVVWQLPFSIAAHPSNTRTAAGWTFVSPDYFSVLHIPIIRGRYFTNNDGATAPGVVIINQEMAKRFWTQGDPLEDQLIVGRTMRPEYKDDPIRRIIGIVGDVRDVRLELPPRPEMYVPIEQLPDSINPLNLQLLPLAWMMNVRTKQASTVLAVENQLRIASGGLPIGSVRTMDDVESRSTATQRFDMTLLVLFAFATLLMAATGMYALLSYNVRRRTREIGIRLTLGAQPTELRNKVFFETIRLSGLGICIGITISLLLGKLISSMLFGVKATDPIAFAAVPVLLSIVGLLAAWIPAYRATTVDPVVALREG